MNPLTLTPPGAGAAYDELADAYDTLTGAYEHDRWLASIVSLARTYGLSGTRALDLGCGTGKSFMPLLDLGFEVTGVDVSPRMAELACIKAPAVPVLVADMATLGRVGRFDLITCLNDAVNYLTTFGQLCGFFGGLAGNLDPAGVAVFDVNSLESYRGPFAQDWLQDMPGTYIGWQGGAGEAFEPGGLATATVTVFRSAGAAWTRQVSRHDQRHWTQASLRAAAHEAGLRITGVLGQRRGAVIEPDFDECEHDKALCFAVHDQKRGD